MTKRLRVVLTQLSNNSFSSAQQWSNTWRSVRTSQRVLTGSAVDANQRLPEYRSPAHVSCNELSLYVSLLLVPHFTSLWLSSTLQLIATCRTMSSYSAFDVVRFHFWCSWYKTLWEYSPRHITHTWYSTSISSVRYSQARVLSSQQRDEDTSPEQDAHSTVHFRSLQLLCMRLVDKENLDSGALQPYCWAHAHFIICFVFTIAQIFLIISYELHFYVSWVLFPTMHKHYSFIESMWFREKVTNFYQIKRKSNTHYCYICSASFVFSADS